MIDAVSAGYGSLYTSSGTAVTSAKPVSAKQADEKTEKSSESQVLKMDTVEISEDARAAALQMKAPPAAPPSDGAQTQAQDVLQDTASQVAAQQAQASADAAPAVSADTEEEASSTSESDPVLTALTESQIQDLVQEGTVTKSEANSELARRAAQKEQLAEMQG